MSAVLALLAATSIYGTSVEDLRREFPHAPVDNAIVADAVAREINFEGSSAEGTKSIRENVIPIVVHFPERRCVVLERPAPTIGGGPPIYCYKIDGDLFLQSYHDGGQ